MLHGLLKDAEDKRPSSVWKTIAGASIGAMNGLLIAMDYTTDEMIDLWRDVKRKDFMSKKWFGIFRKSLYSRDVMRKFVDNTMRQCGFSPKMYLSELYDLTGVDLICTGTVVQTGQPILFGKSFIDVPVSDAIFMSTAYPVGFPPVEFMDPRVSKKVQVIDGGVLMNSPILPLVIRGCDDIDVLAIRTVDEDYWIDGSIGAFQRILSFFPQGNELVSLSWAKRMCKELRVYHAPCEGVDIFDFDKIKDILVEGEIAIKVGAINPSDLIGWLMSTGERAAIFGGCDEHELCRKTRTRYCQSDAPASGRREHGTIATT